MGENQSKSDIFIVEDDKFLRELLVRKLEDEGFQVKVAVDGESALEKIKEEIPRLILLDLILPGMNGFEVLEKIKKYSGLKDVPVIILSNLGQQEEVEKGLKLGAQDYLIKAHFTPQEIIQKIRKFIGPEQD